MLRRSSTLSLLRMENAWRSRTRRLASLLAVPASVRSCRALLPSPSSSHSAAARCSTAA